MLSGVKLIRDKDEMSRRRRNMPENRKSKQSRRESTDTYVVNPQKSADPPQPQGKNCNTVKNQRNSNQIK